MNLPELESESLEVVMLGSFNPKIFHPLWFRKYDLIQEPDVEQSAVQMVTNDISNIEMKGIRCLCVKDRMTFVTSDPSRYEMIQDWLLKIFQLLPHTPINALGINLGVHYRLNDSERWHRIGYALAPKKHVWDELFEMPGMRSLTILAQRTDGFEGYINITVEPSVQFHPGIFVLSNHHFQPTENPNIEGFSAFIRSNWQTARKEAKRVAEKIFEKIP